MTSRRAFLSAALVLASGRLAAQDKAARIHRIGFLDPVSLQANAANMEQFRKGLRDLGYAEGKNLSIEYFSAEGRVANFAPLAGELVRHNVAVIVTSGTPATLAAKNASAGRIPVVTATVVDPVETKVVDSLERPGGNVTGVAVDTADLEAKRLELLRALAPSSRVAVIMDLGNPALVDTFRFGDGQVPTVGGGNPELAEEQADTFTFGFVFGGDKFRASIDYYSIELEDAIFSVPAGEILLLCYGVQGNNPDVDPADPACSSINRTTQLNGNPAGGRPSVPSQGTDNVSTLSTSGLDVQFDWGVDLGAAVAPVEPALSAEASEQA